MMLDIKDKIIKGDKYIWGAYFALCFISIISMYSASEMLTYRSGETYDPILRHSIFLGIGTLVVFILQYVHYKSYRLLGVLLYIVSCVLLIYALINAEKVNDAARWITIFGVDIQPSELAKLGVIITVSYFLAKGQLDNKISNRAFWQSIIVVATACILIFTENLSTAILLGGVAYCIMLIAGVENKKLLIILFTVVTFIGSILLSAYLLDKNNEGKSDEEQSWFFKAVHRANTWNDRIFGFVGEDDNIAEYEKETNDKNFQEHHAAMAISHSNGIGVGPGNSRERNVLPQAYSDFIYAIIVEEWGIFGGVFVMILYLSILFRAYQVTQKCEKAFPSYLIMGIAMLIVFQAIINMMVATGLGPVTGQPLPLISRGGTSVLINSVYFGIMLSISRYATIEAVEENKKNGVEIDIPESISAANPNLNKNIENE